MRVALIPARGGSRRIERKNARDFLGKPMIAYAIRPAVESGLFDHVVVSTDDPGIAVIARAAGAEVPFQRPPALADDSASTDAVVLHGLRECERLWGAVDEGCCIYPAVPFLTAALLARGLEALKVNDASSAFPVVAYDYPIEQAFTLDGGRPIARWPELLLARSQDLPVHYHDAGMFYWFDARRFTSTGQLFNADSAAFVVSTEVVQDINTPEDWRRAELKYQVLHTSRDG